MQLALELACMIFKMSSRDIEAALKRNTTLKVPNISTNMPTLIHHLRQLVAAYSIIERHALQGSHQPARSSSLSTSSSLALMHAAESCRLIQWNLFKRLFAAVVLCMKTQHLTGPLPNLPGASQLKPPSLNTEEWTEVLNNMEFSLSRGMSLHDPARHAYAWTETQMSCYLYKNACSLQLVHAMSLFVQWLGFN